MTNVQLENERLIIQINESGAELARIYDKDRQREVLWDASPQIWPRHAPILFPFVGNCYQGIYQYHGRSYPMTPHGFARDRIFELTALARHEAHFQLSDDAESYQVYPFHFTLDVGHKLESSRVLVTWKVTNHGDGVMWFMIGGHPAFRVPLGKTIHDFTFRFGQQERLHYEAPDENGYITAKKQGYLLLRDGMAPLAKGFFKETLTYIFDEGQVDEISLLVWDEPYITMHCKEIPYLGIWTKEETHPFVCLEPWFGRCADEGYTGELKDRTGVMCLNPGKTFKAGYIIEIH